jgi:hypothetical protein
VEQRAVAQAGGAGVCQRLDRGLFLLQHKPGVEQGGRTVGGGAVDDHRRLGRAQGGEEAVDRRLVEGGGGDRDDHVGEPGQPGGLGLVVAAGLVRRAEIDHRVVPLLGEELELLAGRLAGGEEAGPREARLGDAEGGRRGPRGGRCEPRSGDPHDSREGEALQESGTHLGPPGRRYVIRTGGLCAPGW